MISTLPNSESISATLHQHLETDPPELLYHYTTAAGCVGILSLKQIWATNSAFFNDATEHKHAIDLAKNQLHNLLHNNIHYKDKWTPAERRLIEEMHHHAAAGGIGQFYVISFSQERDLLSQWRAYCGDSGGYSIGFPSLQLINMARNQNFMLTKCIYDHNEISRITVELLMTFVSIFNARRETEDEKQLIQNLSVEYGRILARIGAIMKNPAFSEEQEWRLISWQLAGNHPSIDYRGSSKGIIPYYKFPLCDTEYPDMIGAGVERRGLNHMHIIAAPSVDRSRASNALHAFTIKYAPGASYDSSRIPYRTW